MNTGTVANGLIAGFYGVPMEIDFKDSNMADTASLVPGVVRLALRTVSFTGDP